MGFLNIKNVMRPSDNFKMECIDKPKAVGIVLFNEDFTKIMLVKQFRAGTNSEIYEIPAGIVEQNEVPLDTAIREVKEETGYDDIIDIIDLGCYLVSPGYTTEKMYLYRARINPGSEQKELELDEHEDLQCKWVDINEVAKITTDMKTIFGLTKALAIPKKKIGIYGGTFNPLTYLHLLTVERAIEEKQLDYCIIEPVGNRYIKKDIISVEKRREMIQLGIENNNKLILGNYESSKLIQPNTIETLEHYKQKYGWCEIYFICGSDNLKDMCGENSWSNYVKILTNFNIICIQRDNDNVYQDIILKNENLIKNKNHIHVIHENVVNNISSSAVRNLVKSDMISNYLVPEKVEKYIHDNDLYAF